MSFSTSTLYFSKRSFYVCSRRNDVEMYNFPHSKFSYLNLYEVLRSFYVILYLVLCFFCDKINVMSFVVIMQSYWKSM